MKETPVSLAEQILQEFLRVKHLTVPECTCLVNAILTVINPLCNEVARLEAEAAEAYANGRRSILAEEAFDDAAG